MKEKKEKVEKEKKDLGTKEPGTGELVSEGRSEYLCVFVSISEYLYIFTNITE